jgi:hypothetical protein
MPGRKLKERGIRILVVVIITDSVRDTLITRLAQSFGRFSRFSRATIGIVRVGRSSPNKLRRWTPIERAKLTLKITTTQGTSETDFHENGQIDELKYP